MKKYITIMLLSATILSTPVLANDEATNKARMAAHHKIVAQLDLTNEQEKEIKALHENTKAKMAPIMTQMKALREQAKQVRSEGKEAFEKILTPAQKAKMAKKGKKNKAQKD